MILGDFSKPFPLPLRGGGRGRGEALSFPGWRSRRCVQQQEHPASPRPSIPSPQGEGRRNCLGALLLITALVAACAPAEQAPAPEAPAVISDAPAGEYRLDRSHADLMFRVNHIGFSMYTGRFSDFDATLHFDPASPETMRVEASVNVGSLSLPAPPEGFVGEMLGPQWFDAAQFPTITFRSTAVELTSTNTARVSGDLTLHGVTKPVALDVTFNGGYAGHPMDPNGRIGFSARGSLRRSEFGMGYGVPPEGSTMGVGDDVEIVIETEFTGPPLAAAPNP